MARRACKGTTKAGKPCGNTAVLETGFCIAHSPKEVGESRGFGGAQAGAGRPKLPKPHERMRERIEEEIDTILKPYFEAIENAVLHASEKGTVYLSDHPDLGARIAAAERLLDRVYGKPAQAVELSGGGDGRSPIEIVAVDDREVATAAQQFLRQLRPQR